jgi:hypothetical protein
MGGKGNEKSSEGEKRSKDNQSKIHRLGADEEDECPTVTIHKLTLEPEDAEPIMVKVNVEDQSLNMEWDCGAPVSVHSELSWKSFGSPDLDTVGFKINSYTDHPVKILGAWYPFVKFGSFEGKLPLVVVSGDRKPLIGRNWIRKLNSQPLGINNLPAEPDIGSNWKTKFPEVFSDKLGEIKGFEAALKLKKEASPKFCKPRPIPYALKPKVEAELDRMEKEGVIEKISFSEWASPLVIVPKPSGDVRICGDYKVTLNAQLEVDCYPLPTAQNVFAELDGAKVFTKLDLSRAYLQLKLTKSSRRLVTINTHKGLYQFRRLPYGVASAPALFQKLIEIIIQDLEGVKASMDDLIVGARNQQEHDRRLQAVLIRLKKFGIVLNFGKCEINKSQITYLGFIVNEHGIKPMESKVKAIREFPQPKDASEVKSFLGLVNFYGKFVPKMATEAAPLYDLLRKDVKFQWKKNEQTSFDKIKQLLSNSPVLAHYDPKLPIRVYCDASAVGVGAVLNLVYQDGKELPVAYASKKLSETEKHYAQIEREALALVIGVSKFHQYLYGREFELVTDHKPLLGILSSYKPSSPVAFSRIQRWFLTLANYNYKLIFKPTNEVGNADSLSRGPIDMKCTDECSREHSIMVLKVIESSKMSSQQVKQLTKIDPVLKEVFYFTHRGWPEDVPEDWKPYFQKRDEISIEDGILLWGQRVIVPQALRESVLKTLHESHIGIVRMKSVARNSVWWPGIDETIEETAKSCEACAKVKDSPPTAPVHQWLWPSKPWSRIHLDFAGPFLGKMFLIIIDARTKWPEVAVMNVGSTTASAVIQSLKKTFSRHGLPDQIVSDNGPQFVSAELKEFLEQCGIKHTLTPPYHPSSNGEAERFVRELKSKLKAMESTSSSLSDDLTQFLSIYRTTPHSTTGLSPAELMYGRRLVTKLDKMRPNVDQKIIKKPEVNTATLRSFQVGDTVWIRDYRDSKPKWVKAVVEKLCSPVSYFVNVDGKAVKRHIDQMFACSSRSMSGDMSIEPARPSQEEAVRPVMREEAAAVEQEQIQLAQEEEEIGPLVNAEEFAEPGAMEPPVTEPAETEEPRRSARLNKGVPPPRLGY